MLFGLLFAFWRFMEIITLVRPHRTIVYLVANHPKTNLPHAQIPTMGMLAYFVNIYTNANMLTPTSILVLFIVSTLGAVWSVATLFTYHRSRANSRFVAFIDLCFVGGFIAGVYYLRGVQGDNCSSLNSGSWTANLGLFGGVTFSGQGLGGATWDKTCAMLKAAWVFGIMNCVFFFVTSMVAFFVGGRHDERRKEVYVEERRYRTSSHGGRRSGSHRSHRSSHSARRGPYV